MPSTGAPTFRTTEEALEIAAALGPRLRERIPEAEANRRLPEQTVKDLCESGLLALQTPRRWGGAELNLDALIEVSAKLAEACSSTGWVYALWASHMWLIAQYPEQVQEMVFADLSCRISSVVNTVGEAHRVDGGFRWSGRGFYSSGVDYSSWLVAALDVPAVEGGPVERHWMILRREDYEIIDDWDPVGLKGTGSKTIVINDAFIPDERIVNGPSLSRGDGLLGAKLYDSPMYGAAVDFTFSLPLPAAELGIATGAVQAFAARVRERLASGNPRLQVEQTGTLMRIAEASAQVDAARAVLLANARRYCNMTAQEATAMDRARCRRDNAFASHLCRTAVNSLFEGAGASSIFMTSDLQRLWRDGNVAASHHGLMWDVLGLSYGRLLAGLSLMPDARGL